MKTPRLSSGQVISQTAKLKAFPLADILSLASGLLLPASGARAVHELVGYITGTPADAADTQSKDARACLEEQLPFLKSVDYTQLHAAFKTDRAHFDDRLALWLDTQVRKYGDEHYIMPLARWERRRNSHKL